MGAKKKEASKAVVVSSEKHFGRRKKIGVALLAFIIVVVAGVVFAVIKHPWDKPTKTVATPPPANYAQVHTTTNKLKYSGKEAEAQQNVQKAIDSATDDRSKAYYNMEMGALYESKKDCQTALKYYRVTESYHVTDIHYQTGIARCSQTLGDNKTALDYYKQAYNAIDRSQNDYQSQEQELQLHIKSLGGSV